MNKGPGQVGIHILLIVLHHHFALAEGTVNITLTYENARKLKTSGGERFVFGYGLLKLPPGSVVIIQLLIDDALVIVVDGIIPHLQRSV